MSAGHSHVGRQDHPRWRRWLILAAAIVGLVSGAVGFYQYEASAPLVGEGIAPPGFKRALASVYSATQLFLLHTPHLERPVNVFLEIGRWSALLAFGLTAGFALSPVFRSEWRHVRLWSRRRRIVICGAGWRGVPLARDYFRQAHPGRPAAAVIMIERDPGSPGVAECEKLGIPCIIGDATDVRVLTAAGVHKAANLIAVCTDDGTNIEIAVRARSLTEKRRRIHDPLVCHVHIGDAHLRGLVRRERLIADSPGHFTATTAGIDVYESSARWLFQRYPLDRAGANPILHASHERVHLVILGFGEMGEAVLLQAARICHLANARRMRVTVVDKDPTRQGAFRDRYPEIDQICDLAFLTFDLHRPNLVEAIDAFRTETHRLVTFVVCLPDDTRNLTLAHKLADILKADVEIPRQRAPIYVRVSSRDGLALVLSEQHHRALYAGQIESFGMLEDSCNVLTLERPEIDVLARAIHETYIDEQMRKGDTIEKNPALVSWDDLPEDMRESNRHAADHIDTKLRAIGCHALDHPGTAAPLTGLGEDDVEILARMEHARFCAERFLAGWHLDPNPHNPKNLKTRTSPTLVSWDALPETEREKDREQVRCLPAILKRAGKYICR